MKKIKRYSTILLTSLCITACQGAGKGTSVSYDSVYMETQSAVNAGFAMDSGMAEMKSSYMSGEKGVPTENAITRGAGEEEILVNNAERKLIKNISMNMETTKFDEAIQMINQSVTSFGGYIESSGISGHSISSDSERYADLQIRIPQEKLDEFLEKAGEIGNIIYKNETVQDVSLQYADTEDHIKVLETEQKRLLELLEKADSIETVIAVEERLSAVRYELESYQTQIKLYDNNIVYSTIQITLNEVKIYSQQSEDGMLVKISKGIKENFLFVIRAVENIIVFFVSSIPMIFVSAAGFWLVFLIVKSFWKKRRSKDTKEEN